jgi:dihydroflavonol-4-reductase
MPAIPRLGFTFVDVRDVADLHIRAMSSPAAGGERFLAVDRFLWMQDVGRILRERLGAAAAKVPTRVAPSLLIRAMALFDPSVRTIVGDLGQSPTYTAEKAKTTLGWTPRPIEDSITDTAQSLVERGLAGPGR